ncbi:MAG: hypothetical protein AB9886_00050 [Candidatus Cryosericum sp.]
MIRTGGVAAGGGYWQRVLAVEREHETSRQKVLDSDVTNGYDSLKGHDRLGIATAETLRRLSIRGSMPER